MAELETDLEKALADIDAIKAQLARGSEFRGWGPATVALTGLMAGAAAAAQAAFMPDPVDVTNWLAIWVLTAVLGIALVVAEATTRSRRLHSHLADEMIHAAAVQFVPAAAVGALLPVVILNVAPDAVWMLPGLWQLVFGLGIFAASRALPQAMAVAGAWYLACGLVVLAVAAGDRSLSPWAMGLPFGIGQLLFAAILHRALGGPHGGF
ncbi:hypothetical protein CH338_29585 [Rhodoplanes elegans]|uniref:Uncharacterized protein n=2 Tax=Rhodoplanes elegans TaxID=29408 RepID=A0A327JT96_9BRAD|nr:hypothetical protein [Rhodoplanes elegans]RAI28122.1 hypothetical protein CH338_29585 [Rhodoplanes elegans]